MQLQPGQKVFIPAGSGSIGTFAIQLASHLGARVGTITGTANVARCAGLPGARPRARQGGGADARSLSRLWNCDYV